MIQDHHQLSIGREFSISIPMQEDTPWSKDGWTHGFSYHYGCLPPRYPVPAKMDMPRTMVTALWVMGHMRTDMWLALDFNDHEYTG